MMTRPLKSLATLALMTTICSPLALAATGAHPMGAHPAAPPLTGAMNAAVNAGVNTSPHTSETRFNITLDGESWTIVHRDGDLEISINGEAAPADRIQQRGSQYRLLGRGGEPVAQLMVGPRGNLMFQSISGGEPRERSEPQRRPRGEDRAERAEQPEPPRHRGSIGITLSPMPDAAAEQLEVDPDEVVLIGRVRQGGPARKAGVQLFDVITAVDGRKPVTREMVREHVRRKNAGDSITLTILRQGETHEIDITLEPVERESMDRRSETLRWLVGELHDLRSQLSEQRTRMEAEFEFPEEFRASLKAAEEEIRAWWESAFDRDRPEMIFSEKRRQELRDVLTRVDRDLRRSAENFLDDEQFEQWYEAVRDRREQFSQRMREMLRRIELDAPEIEFQRDEEGRRIVRMRGPGTLRRPHDRHGGQEWVWDRDREAWRSAPAERRVERLESRLESLEQRLMRIEAQLKQLSPDR